MNIINKTKGPISYSTSVGNYGDCGAIAEGQTEYFPYPEVSGTVKIGLCDYNGTINCMQTLSVNGGDDITISVSISSPEN